MHAAMPARGGKRVCPELLLCLRRRGTSGIRLPAFANLAHRTKASAKYASAVMTTPEAGSQERLLPVGSTATPDLNRIGLIPIQEVVDVVRTSC